MKTTEIVGYRRAEIGTKFSKELRANGNVPCVIYGGDEVVHFHTPMYLFRELLYTPEATIVNVNVEGKVKQCIVQDAQFHPVSETLLHVDFLEISDDKPVSIEVPVKLKGTPVGVSKGGQLFMKTRKLKIKALPKQLPDFVEVSVGHMDLGQSLLVRDIKAEGVEIISNPSTAVIQIIIPRALKSKQAN